MNVPELGQIKEQLKQRASDLEEKQKQEEKRNKGDGSTPAVWRKVEPKIRRDVVEDCLGDIEDIEDSDEFFEVVAEWRRSLNDELEFLTTNSPTVNERNSIKRSELRNWVGELTGLIPEDELSSCGICGSNKLPKSDRRRKTGYVWECPDCSV